MYSNREGFAFTCSSESSLGKSVESTAGLTVHVEPERDDEHERDDVHERDDEHERDDVHHHEFLELI